MLKREKGQQMGTESSLPLCGMNQTAVARTPAPHSLCPNSEVTC